MNIKAHENGIRLLKLEAMDKGMEMGSYSAEELEHTSMDKWFTDEEALATYKRGYKEIDNPEPEPVQPELYYLILNSGNQGARLSDGYDSKEQADRYRRGELRNCARSEPIYTYSKAKEELERLIKLKGWTPRHMAVFRDR